MEQADPLGALGNRWALRILMALASGPMRFTDLRLALPSISAKMLTARLRELEAGALVARHPLAQQTTGPGYALAPNADDLRPALDLMARWAAARAVRGSPG